MPFSENSLKAKVKKSQNSDGEERLKVSLSGNLLPDTNVDWYYLTFKANIEKESRPYTSTFFQANTYQGGSVPIINYQQGNFSESLFFDYLDYLPSADRKIEVVLDTVAYKGKSWYKISSDDPSGNSISELPSLGINYQDINKQLSKSIQNLGFLQNDNPDLIIDDISMQAYDLFKPEKINKKTADKIINFNPSTDTLEIDTDSFGIDSSATFAAGKNRKVVKRQLAKLDIDFLYDEKRGGLYFNENGSNKGFGDGGIIAILKGAPDLTINNLDFT